MRRDYGSRLFFLIDSPISPSSLPALNAATADALRKWEPRFAFESLSVLSSAAGKVALSLTGRYIPTGQPLEMEVAL